MNYTSTTDEDLMDAICREDHEAFAQIDRRFRKRLKGYFYVCKDCDPSLAEDLAQDVLIRIYIYRHLYDPIEGTFVAWAMRIASNRAIDYQRRKMRIQEVQIDEELHNPPCNRSSPEAEIELKQRSGNLTVCFEKLNEGEREIIQRILLGMKQEEIANQLAISSVAVTRKKKRAVKELQECLQQQEARGRGR